MSESVQLLDRIWKKEIKKQHDYTKFRHFAV